MGNDIRYGATAAAACLCPSLMRYRRQGLVEPHELVPERRGSCGFYAHADDESVDELFHLVAVDAAVSMDVELFGRVFEHGSDLSVEGWRAEKIRVLGVQVPTVCTSCEEVFAPAELCTSVVPMAATEEAPLGVHCAPCAGAVKATAVALSDLASWLGTEVSWVAVDPPRLAMR